MLRSSILSVLLAAVMVALSSAMQPPLAFLKKKTSYTPLLFFKVPKGTMDECDGMEKVIRSIEKERGVTVERLDIVRDPAARKLYDKLVEGNLRSPFPLLYHRESLQRVYGSADADLVRSWSKGRLLPDREEEGAEVAVLGPGGDGGDDDAGDFEGEEMDMEELEMEMDAELTPMQRRGKEAMKRRMEEGRKK